MAVTCCLAAKALHSGRLVHRDLRLDNVVQLGPQQFVVIDLESAAWISIKPLPQEFSRVLCTCTSSTLDEAGWDIPDTACARVPVLMLCTCLILFMFLLSGRLM